MAETQTSGAGSKKPPTVKTLRGVFDGGGWWIGFGVLGVVWLVRKFRR